MKRRWWDDPSSYQPSSISDEARKNDQYLKGIFLLEKLLGTVVNTVNWFSAEEDQQPLVKKISKDYRKVVSRAVELLSLSIFSNLNKFKPEFPCSLDTESFLLLEYPEDIEKFYQIINKEYLLNGSKTFAIPVEIQVTINKIEEITNIKPEKLVESSMDRITLKSKNYEHLTIQKNGLIEYQDKDGNVRRHQLKTRRSDFKFLMYLARHSKKGEPVSYEDIAKGIKSEKSLGYNDPANRVREMHKLLQKNLELKPRELILVDRGYKLTCPAKIK